MKIEVTQADIDKYRNSRSKIALTSHCCPVANALRRIIEGATSVSCGRDNASVWLKDKTYKEFRFPEEAEAKITELDLHGNMEPFTFEAEEVVGD